MISVLVPGFGRNSTSATRLSLQVRPAPTWVEGQREEDFLHLDGLSQRATRGIRERVHRALMSIGAWPDGELTVYGAPTLAADTGLDLAIVLLVLAYQEQVDPTLLEACCVWGLVSPTGEVQIPPGTVHAARLAERMSKLLLASAHPVSASIVGAAAGPGRLLGVHTIRDLSHLRVPLGAPTTSFVPMFVGERWPCDDGSHVPVEAVIAAQDRKPLLVVGNSRLLVPVLRAIVPPPGEPEALRVALALDLRGYLVSAEVRRPVWMVDDDHEALTGGAAHPACIAMISRPDLLSRDALISVIDQAYWTIGLLEGTPRASWEGWALFPRAIDARGYVVQPPEATSHSGTGMANGHGPARRGGPS